MRDVASSLSADSADTPQDHRPDTPDGTVRHSDSARRGMRALITAVGVLLAVVIVSPIALSSQDLVRWASSPEGLGLDGWWPYVVFIALDAAAAACVGMTIYAAARGESAGAFSGLVWVLAGGSAFANYRHGLTTAAADDQWFFPAMSLTGPLLLELTVRRIRRWVKTKAGRYESPLPHFRVLRWVPMLGHFRETWGAYRVALLSGDMSTPGQAIDAYRQLMPDGGVAVARALRQQRQADTTPTRTVVPTQRRTDTATDTPAKAKADPTPDAPRLTAPTPLRQPTGDMLTRAVGILRDARQAGRDITGTDMARSLGLHNAGTDSGKRTGQRWLRRAEDELGRTAVA